LFGQPTQCIQALSVGSLGLEQYDFRPQSHRISQAGPPAAGAAYDFKLGGVTQSSFKRLAYDIMVVNNQQSRWCHLGSV
jgi:hypothetical protein